MITGERAPLLYRSQRQRSAVTSYSADRVLGYRPINARRGVISRSRSGRLAFRALHNVQSRYKRSLGALQLA